MTTASSAVRYTTARHHVKKPRLQRIALVVGLALVSWGRRSSNQPTPTHDEVHLRRQVDREADLARADYSASRTFYGIIR